MWATFENVWATPVFLEEMAFRNHKVHFYAINKVFQGFRILCMGDPPQWATSITWHRGCCPVLRATQCVETYITRSKNDFCTSFSRSGLLAVFVTGCNSLRGPAATKARAIWSWAVILYIKATTLWDHLRPTWNQLELLYLTFLINSFSWSPSLLMHALYHRKSPSKSRPHKIAQQKSATLIINCNATLW